MSLQRSRKDKLHDEITKEAKKARKDIAPSHQLAASFILGSQPAGYGNVSAAPYLVPPPLQAPMPPHMFFQSPPPFPLLGTGHGSRGNLGPGACVFHPESSTHTTAQCRAGAPRAKPAAHGASGGANGSAANGHRS